MFNLYDTVLNETIDNKFLNKLCFIWDIYNRFKVSVS